MAVSPLAMDLFPVRLTGFVHLLRSAGIQVGSDQLLGATTAVEQAALTRSDDLYTCLFAFFVNRNEDRLLYTQAFDLYWQQVDTEGQTLADLVSSAPDTERVRQRLADVVSGLDYSRPSTQLQWQTSYSASSRERLQHKDFADMSQEELAQAKKMLARLRLTLPLRKSRRFSPAVNGNKLDRRASFRAAMRHSQELPLRFSRPRNSQPPLVLICDISGSMEQYSRMLLHFMHALSNAPGVGRSRGQLGKVFSFVFATELTAISRQLAYRDVDAAVEQAAGRVKDWSSGTRIGHCLKQFNQLWSRRVLGQGATVILISDGLDREGGSDLAKQMERLGKSCRRLIWLNPLLAYSGFEPRARGIRQMLPHVDEFRAAHSINSLSELGDVLTGKRNLPGTWQGRLIQAGVRA